MNTETGLVFVPFLGDLFSINDGITYYKASVVFVPFLGDLFSIGYYGYRKIGIHGVFVPFLGDLFSMMQK